MSHTVSDPVPGGASKAAQAASVPAAAAAAPSRGLNTRHVVLAAVALLLASWGFLPEFSVTLLNYIGLYALVALGLVMLTGVGGMTSFGQAAFVGLGAYATALACTGMPGMKTFCTPSMITLSPAARPCSTIRRPSAVRPSWMSRRWALPSLSTT